MDSILRRVAGKRRRADASQHGRFFQAKGKQTCFCPSPVIPSVVAKLASANASSFLIVTASKLYIRH